MDDKELEPLVEGILRRWLGAAGLKSFSLENGEDHDGDRALFVNVLFDEASPIEPSALLGMTGEIRDELHRRNDPRLPYIRVDAPNTHHEAAE